MKNKILRPKMLQLANHIGCKKEGGKGLKAGYTYESAEYLICSPACVTDEMADVCTTMERRERSSASVIASRCGKSLEDTTRILNEAADVGILFAMEKDGVDIFWLESWVPGVMEQMNNHKENVAKYPEIAIAFDLYGKTRGPVSTGMFPVGVGLMRVIPIQSAIDGSSKKVSYEEVSEYIENNTLFSVSDCSCRTSREAMGEGCGHLKEDMCIQLGDAASYYIRTKRGREITKEEAYAIIKKAEENGLMHQITNTDGPGKAHAICNCCGCGCYSLRNAEMYMNVDTVRSNYVAKVDKEACVACGECVKNCPMNALQLGQKICSSKPIVESLVQKETPRDTVWTEEKWNVDYRINRKNVVDSGTAPCKTKCPAHISIQGYIKLASQGKYKEALELIKRENPFPAICGRVCPRGCESECTRGDIDEPIAIDDIKKFIAEQDLKTENRFVPKQRHDYGKKIAIIGGGPSGLSCAYYLGIDGYDVTVFEKEKVLGGMLTLGIPEFRLEKDVVNAEIDILKELGVKFKVGVEVGKDLTISDLRKDGFKGFYIAIGASKGRMIDAEGENAENVMTGVEFLKKVSLGEDVKLSKNTIIIGGGNVAIDVARTAVRKGGDNAMMFCLESEKEMPALPEEIHEATEEGIKINYGYGVNKLILEKGKVAQIEFKKCVSVFDENGKFSPKYDMNNIMTVECDNLILSVGQSIDFGKMLDGEKVELNANGTAKADSFTLQTAQEDIFVGGDVFTGPKYAIDAIAQGKEGAISLHRYVQNGQSLVFGRDRREYHSMDKTSLELDSFDTARRQVAKDETKVKTFVDTRGVFTEDQIKKETERCLGCGATIVDQFSCVGCGQCTVSCKFDAIKIERVYDEAGLELNDMPAAVMKHVIKRKFKIVLKNFKKIFKK